MAWKIAQKDGYYRIWSTVSDQWITDWVSRTEAIAIYYDDALCQFKKKVIEKYFSFPHHWSGDDGIINDEEGHDRLLAWLETLSTKREDEYYQYIDETFEKIREELEAAL